ncbi:MAG: hypothetical protein K8R63_12680 [Bacteroidales bacterium]|nr:hypothetical protein [Bacteroidales bacterium]
MQTDFDKMDPKERLMFYEKLLQYGLPRLHATQLTSDIEKITDEQLDYIIHDLKESINDQGRKN